jgi:hypothetical protein
MTEYFGTLAEAIAVMILAPALAMPPCSASRPTMKPVTSARNTSGMSRLQHRSMKCVAFSALSLNSTPWLARMPTGWPCRWREAAHQRVAVQRLELVEAAVVDEAQHDLARVGRDGARRG